MRRLGVLALALLGYSCASYAPLAKVGATSPDGRLVVVSASGIGGKKQIVHYRETETGLDFYVIFDGAFAFGFQIGPKGAKE